MYRSVMYGSIEWKQLKEAGWSIVELYVKSYGPSVRYAVMSPPKNVTLTE